MSSVDALGPERRITPLLVKPKVAWKMLSCGNTRGYELLAAGELSPSRMEVHERSPSSQFIDT